MNISFYRTDRGYPRVRVDETYRPLAEFLQADAANIAWVDNLVSEVEAAIAAPAGHEFIADGNASEITVTPEAVVIDHDYVGTVTIQPREFLNVLNSWLDFLRSPH